MEKPYINDFIKKDVHELTNEEILSIYREYIKELENYCEFLEATN